MSKRKLLDFSRIAEYHISRVTSETELNRMPEVIYEHTGYSYSYFKTNKGCVLLPTFSKDSTRNSFVPEINIDVLQSNSQTTFKITVKPVAFVRVFIIFWYAFIIFFEVFAIIFFANKGEADIGFIVVPIAMGVFAYAFCKYATKQSFLNVIDAIKKEYY